MEALGYPATWPTSCFIDGGCGETVFAHTNGFGDFVLFDDLGPPWPIHECYLNRFVPGSSSTSGDALTLLRSAAYLSATITDTPPPKKIDSKRISRVAPETLLGKGHVLIAGYVQDYVERRADRLSKDLGHLGQQLFRSTLGSA